MTTETAVTTLQNFIGGTWRERTFCRIASTSTGSSSATAGWTSGMAASSEATGHRQHGGPSSGGTSYSKISTASHACVPGR